MPSTDRKLELKAKTSMTQTASQASVYAKGIMYYRGKLHSLAWRRTERNVDFVLRLCYHFISEQNGASFEHDALN
jgi:hypothetical protein